MNEEMFRQSFVATRSILYKMEKIENSVTGHAKGFGHFYTLWALVSIDKGFTESC